MATLGFDLSLLNAQQKELYDLGNVRPEMRYCTSGHDQDTEIRGICPQYSDYLLFTCKVCHENWAACFTCKKNTRPLYTTKAMRSHKSKMHQDIEDGEGAGSAASKRSSNEAIESNKQSVAAKRQRTPEGTHPGETDEDQGFIEPHVSDAAWASPTTDTPEAIQSAVFSSSQQLRYQPIVNMHKTTLCFAEQKNINFFRFCMTRGEQSLVAAGRQYLTARCMAGVELTFNDYRTLQLPDEFQQMLLEYAFLCFSAGKRNRTLLCGVLKKLHDGGTENGWHCCQKAIGRAISLPDRPAWVDGNSFVSEYLTEPYSSSKIDEGAHTYSLNFPTTTGEIRSKFLEGKFSIMKNLPFPEIKGDIDDHAYIDLEACIRHALAFSNCRIQRIEAVSTTVNNATTTGYVSHPAWSLRAGQVLEFLSIPLDKTSEPIPCYLYIWSDDADTNSSSMQGRANVWVKTMTIGAPAENGNLIHNTYPVAVGLKKASHEKVELKHAEDLRRLQSSDLSPFYLGDINKLVECRFGVFANLGDQPEKRGMNGLLLGGSTWGARSWVSANHKDLYANLRACEACLTKMKETFGAVSTQTKLPQCNKCLNWDVLKTNTDLSLTQIPRHYPYKDLADQGNPCLAFTGYVNRIVAKDGKHFIRPFRVTYEGLRDAVKEAHYGYTNGNWSIDNCKAFLTVETFNTETINKFFEHAERARAHQIASTTTTEMSTLPEFKRQIEIEKEQFPERFQPMPLPAVSTRPHAELSSYIEGLLHIGAIGVNKRSGKTVRDVLKSMGCWTLFRERYAKYLDSCNYLKLEWLKVMPFPAGDNFHGWNAVNWLAFTRLMPWFYQTVDELKKQAPTITLPDESTQKAWKLDYNKHWLKIRGLDTKGNAAELRARVAEEMERDVPTSVRPEPALKSDQIQDLILSLYDMMECLYCGEVTEDLIMKTEYAIRIHLSSYDSVTTALFVDKSVITTYNYMCLLNLPETMRIFGPLRHNWEGSFKGEGILPMIKAQHTQGIRKNWALNLLKNVLTERVFRSLLDDRSQPLMEDASESLSYNGAMESLTNLDFHKSYFHTYDCITEVNDIFETERRDKKKPLSVVIVRDKDKPEKIAKIYTFVHKGTEDVIEIAIDAQVCTIPRFGVHYYKFVPLGGTNKATAWSDVLMECGSISIEFALLLPLLNKDNNSRLFAVASRNWVYLSPANSLNNLVN